MDREQFRSMTEPWYPQGLIFIAQSGRPTSKIHLRDGWHSTVSLCDVGIVGGEGPEGTYSPQDLCPKCRRIYIARTGETPPTASLL